jgi:PAS domain S-box-containing protein
VLLVEDDDEFADLAEIRLERESSRLTVDAVSTGAAALAELDDGADEVDCVVSDYDLPERDGVELLEAVREDEPTMPFVLYTGKGNEAVASEAISAGVTDYLRKGIGRDQWALLANRITNAVDQLHATERANATERRYDALFEHTSDAIARVEFEDDAPIVESVNPAFEATFLDDDATPGDAVGRDLDVIVDGEGERDVARALADRASTAGTQSAEVTREVQGGLEDFFLELVPIDARESSGCVDESSTADESIDAAFAVYTNLSEQEAHRKRFRAFVEQSTDIITVLEETGRTRYQSPSIERLTGHTPEAIVGENIFDYIHPDDRSRVIERFYEGLDRPEYTPVAEYRFEAADGSYRWLESRGNNQLDNPVVEGFVVNSRDVTERKSREEELKRQNERLDEFGSIVSHDLRNPLNVARGHLELAADECESEHLEQIELAHDRMEELLEDLLTIARVGEIERDPSVVGLDSLVDRAWQTVETADATLAVDADCRVRADGSRLQELLENLFANAVKHAGENVAVTVATCESGFYVADDGPGIPEDVRADVFDSGFTTTEDGTGFGLAVVNEVAQAHGWTVDVDESDDGGTRIDVTGVDLVED